MHRLIALRHITIASNTRTESTVPMIAITLYASASIIVVTSAYTSVADATASDALKSTPAEAASWSTQPDIAQQ